MLSRTLTILLVLLMMLSTMGLSGCSIPGSVDLILYGGRIYTMDSAQPLVDAVAVRRGRIVYAGDITDLSKYRGRNTRELDLRGMTTLPGLNDAHGHLMSLGRFLHQIDLIGTRSIGEIRDMVKAKIEESEPGAWIQGRGWDQNDWEVKQFPTWRDLAGTESHPVYVRRVDGHAAWVNRTTLELCGIDRNTPDPKGGRIIRDERGDPTGVFIDDACDLISRNIPLPTREEKIQWLKSAITKCHSVGLVGVHDAGVDSAKMEIFLELQRQGELNLRVYAMLDDSTKAKSWLYEWFRKGHRITSDHFLTVRSIKLYADGALGSRGAALLEPYSDDPSNCGLLMKTPEELYKITKDALDAGFQVGVHALGDAGVRTVLDTYERALKENPRDDHRFRVEHCEVMAPEDMPRLAKLGVIPSMQPTHATSDMPWLRDRLGPERIKHACIWRTLLDQGCRIPCGSDFPVESPNPLWGIYSAMTRQDHDGQPSGGWFPEQRMTIEEAVKGFTIDAAYAEFADDLKGSITVGKLADFTVLSQDIFKIPPEEILKTRVMYTIIGGEVVYKDPGMTTNLSDRDE